MKKVGLLLLVVPGAFLHDACLTLCPELWPVNDQFVTWWHNTWWGKK